VGYQIPADAGKAARNNTLRLTACLTVCILYRIQSTEKAAMKHSKTAFVFTPELGARLRLLRLRRGLSLREMAALMDRNRPGSYNPLALLERGEVKHPSFNLIVDYLRACGAGFADLLDLLNPHTSRPPVLKEKGDKAVAELLKSLPRAEQRAMLRWERATTAAQEAKAAAAPGRKKPRVQTDRERVFRIIWSFIHANWSEVFEQRLYEAMRTVRDDVPRRAPTVNCSELEGSTGSRRPMRLSRTGATRPGSRRPRPCLSWKRPSRCGRTTKPWP